MSTLLCPILTQNGPDRNCVEEKCTLWVKNEMGHTCALVKSANKTVGRLDTISAQMAEVQVLLNMLVNEAKGN